MNASSSKPAGKPDTGSGTAPEAEPGRKARAGQVAQLRPAETDGEEEEDVMNAADAGLGTAQAARRKAKEKRRKELQEERQALKQERQALKQERKALEKGAPEPGKPGPAKPDKPAPSAKPSAAPARQPAGKPDETPTLTTVPVPPVVAPARVRGRHWMAVLSFMLMVLLPACLSGWYLWNRAADQYASFVGFSVRTEEKSSAIELLGSVANLSGSSSTDTDILYEFLQSQELVAAIDAELDLRSIWAKADPAVDPIFAFHPPGTIEDVVSHWNRMVKIYYDSGTGLLDLRVLAFDPDDAQRIAQAIYRHSSARINELSAIAREDAIGYARDELMQAQDQLREARVALQEFRNRTQIIDPTIQTQSQSGLISALETQLATAQIELRLVQETARPNDPRIRQAELEIEVIRKQIADERAKLGLADELGGNSVADLVGEYEVLAVDLEFAQQSYVAARATYDAARNEARRQSRYLAAHISPTRAERAEYPQREEILGLITLFLFLSWTVVVLVGYALRDRR